jgi:hypothetical protein
LRGTSLLCRLVAGAERAFELAMLLGPFDGS